MQWSVVFTCICWPFGLLLNPDQHKKAAHPSARADSRRCKGNIQVCRDPTKQGTIPSTWARRAGQLLKRHPRSPKKMSQQQPCNYLSLNAFSQLEVVPSSASPSCFSSRALPRRLCPDYSTSELAWSTGLQSSAVCSAPLQCQEAAILPFTLYHEALWGQESLHAAGQGWKPWHLVVHVWGREVSCKETHHMGFGEL